MTNLILGLPSMPLSLRRSLIFLGLIAVGVAAAGVGVIEHGTPRIVPKDGAHWKTKGRVVGVARKAPKFVVELQNDDGVVVKVAASEDGGAYELEWLDPGVYTMRVAAAGYRPLLIKMVSVKAGADVRIDLEFTP